MESSSASATSTVPTSELPWKAFEKAPTLLAAVSSVLYVFGFLVVTGFLGSKGVHDHPLLSSRYIMAGGLTAVCSLMYYFFVWRRVWNRVRNGIKFHPKHSGTFRTYVINYYVIEDLFNCAFFSIWLVAILVRVTIHRFLASPSLQSTSLIKEYLYGSGFDARGQASC